MRRTNRGDIIWILLALYFLGGGILVQMALIQLGLVGG